ncbi:hypothetical protein Tco_1178480, partial [Tanacetum coccineum]
GSVATQGESSLRTFKGKEGRTKVRSSRQKDSGTIKTRPSFHRDLEKKNVGFLEFLHEDGFPYSKHSDILHRHVRIRVIDRNLPLHGTATENA